MAQSNMGFGQRFKLGQAYSPTLANADYTQGMIDMQPTGMGMQPMQMNAPQMMQQPRPSLLDVQMAQQQQPGGLLGFGNNTDAMVGAGQGGGTNWAGLASQAAGLLGSASGGQQQGDQQQAPPPPSPVLRVAQNDKLAKLLAQYGIQGV